MENKEMDTEKDVPFKVYESAQARADRRFRLMWLLIVIMFVALVGTNAGWIVYESTYEDVVMTENTQDGEGVNIIGNGDINYGAETDSNKNTP